MSFSKTPPEDLDRTLKVNPAYPHCLLRQRFAVTLPFSGKANDPRRYAGAGKRRVGRLMRSNSQLGEKGIASPPDLQRNSP